MDYTYNRAVEADFDIHGFPLKLVSSNPLLFRTVLNDLRPFQVRPRATAKGETLLLRVSALPAGRDSTTPPPFAPYTHLAAQHSIDHTVVSCYGKSTLTVIHDLRSRVIRAAAVADPALTPDPAYHQLFTQPVSPWLKQRGLFFLHAACVAHRGRGVLLVGHPRSGKTTLSLAAVRAGFQFLSDEQPLLRERDGSLEILAFPRRIRLPRAMARRLPELGPLLKEQGGDRLVFPVERIRAGCRTEVCPPKLLLFPRFDPAGKPYLRPLHPAAALSRLLEDDHFIWYRNGPWTRLSRRHLTLFQRLVAAVPAFTLRYSDRALGEIPSLLQRRLEKGP